ncbi:MAG: cysteine hydrolase [Candidatus Thiodiazotropha sp. (ex Lucina aurantia)]|nr:cysteine hydrolase [Candidatus Thiodiazotropha sp. (ex Lucina pensylvanica)]MBT3024679.1 cysteine hydrolase [Candidatus Thiodiazotropha taylori]MBT3040454.1 cysteine hydrolase [Candidatus Thiodiazotropha sp. (ex Codakia orbicularis)]MBV2103849.1 cysteine hydrolase [Candidatus Thiodiazotropha sp. (ex Lucina aurantia)]MBV2098835.1 cysteine hydrolase [Candidatus Thiodiazotropha sp. (ex Codakia orbicularis)]
MVFNQTAIILIGFQNDYFLKDGALHGALESSEAAGLALKNTVNLIKRLKDTPTLLINTPIIFTSDYSEITQPVGILKTIKEIGAFKHGTTGCETVAEIKAFSDRIITVPGKRGLNAFSNTSLEQLLQSHDITDVVFAGAVTSICIDTTARTALDKGYSVTILKDCTTGRSSFEQEFYCEEIFPLYAEAITSSQLTEQL